MGGADIIPGVSGGTVALIVGIYEKLITAISRCDGHLLALLARRDFRAAAEHIDLRFLLALGLGVFTGIAALATIMRTLLTDYRMVTLSVFSGLILASSILVGRMVHPQNKFQVWGCCALAAGAAWFAFWLGGLGQIGLNDHLGYFFFCGTIAICAMILPGISGSYILWLLGAYEAITAIISRLTHLQATSRECLTLAVFAAGCGIGLISFSKFLRWLLAHAHMGTMAVLSGFMLGSLRRMWPFQIDLTPEVVKMSHKEYEAYLPKTWNQQTTLCLLAATLAVAAVLLLDRWGRALRKNPSE